MLGDRMYVWQELVPTEGWGMIMALIATPDQAPLTDFTALPLCSRQRHIAQATFGPIAAQHALASGNDIRLVMMEVIEVLT